LLCNLLNGNIFEIVQFQRHTQDLRDSSYFGTKQEAHLLSANMPFRGLMVNGIESAIGLAVR
jgi:hypothetical protein